MGVGGDERIMTADCVALVLIRNIKSTPAFPLTLLRRAEAFASSHLRKTAEDGPGGWGGEEGLIPQGSTPVLMRFNKRPGQALTFANVSGRMAFGLRSTAQDVKEVQKSPAGLNIQPHFLFPSPVSRRHGSAETEGLL